MILSSEINTIWAIKGHSVARNPKTLIDFSHRDADRQTKNDAPANTHMQTDTHKHTQSGHPG